jgi:hypothetical protein
MMLLVVHLVLGHRRLRDLEYYRDDVMVKRVLGLKRLPDVATVSRALASADERSLEKVREVSTSMMLERLVGGKLARVRLDFDGSVLSTGRHAQGTAVGFNKKKGERRYYPLFCTVAQTDQVLDVHHRWGNVHDSNGAETFIAHCILGCESHWARCASRRASTAPSSTRPSRTPCTARRGIHYLGVFRALHRVQDDVRGTQTLANPRRGTQLLRDTVETQVMELAISIFVYPQARSTPEQGAHPTRSVHPPGT